MNINSYNGLISIRYNNKQIIIVVIVILFVSFLLACLLSIFDTYTTYATNIKGQLLINIPIENSDSVNTGKFIKIINDNYYYNIDNVSDLLEMNNTNYQQYYLNVDNIKLKDNQVVKVTLYYNKERIIKKLVEKIF